MSISFNLKTSTIDFTPIIKKSYELREQAALNIAADLVLRTAKLNTPVDTGLLRNSEQKQIKGNIALVGTNTEYAPNVEFGTSKQKAQPYLTPALVDNTNNIKNIFKDLFV